MEERVLPTSAKYASCPYDGKIKEEFANKNYAEALIKLAKSKKIILPTEGNLSPLLENTIFEAFKALGHKWLWVGDEFCTERKLHFK